MAVMSGSACKDLDASIERCWTLVADVANAPSWQRGLELVEVVTRDEHGRPWVCDTVSDAKITKIRVRVQFEYEPPHRVTWSQLESDDLDWMRGSWELLNLGRDRTRATYALEVDPGPIGGFARRPLERLIRPLVVGGRPDELGRALAAMS
jgi:hypothetical protein